MSVLILVHQNKVNIIMAECAERGEEVHKTIQNAILNHFNTFLITPDGSGKAISFSTFLNGSMDDMRAEKLKGKNKLVINDFTLCISNSGLKRIPENLDLSSLRVLDCTNNHLETLPNIPSLIELYCGYNKIKVLPELPKRLKILNCSNNQMDILPELPKSLKILNCSYNQLETLPALPNLKELYAGNNRIERIQSAFGSERSDIFPTSLKVCNVSDNRLYHLPTLPHSLQLLECSYNHLQRLPELPETLVVLVCSNNQIASLPRLPNSLHYLDCSFNELLYIRKELTAKIKNATLLCNFNPLYGYL